MGSLPILGVLALVLAGPVSAALKGHEAPVKRLGKRKEPSAHEKIVSEMWARRIIDAEVSRFSPEDMELLLRMRRAESAGALRLLRRRFKGLRGLAVIHKPEGAERTYYRLTREGFDRYLSIKTQAALRYFEKKGVDAKYVFALKDLKGRALFDEGGNLTEWGDILYSRAAANKPAFWETPWGDVMGNRPPRDAEKYLEGIPGGSSGKDSRSGSAPDPAPAGKAPKKPSSIPSKDGGPKRAQ